MVPNRDLPFGATNESDESTCRVFVRPLTPAPLCPMWPARARVPRFLSEKDIKVGLHHQLRRLCASWTASS